MDIKHFITCDKPRSVYNKTLRSFVTASCGRCPSCLSNKTSKYISKIYDFINDSSFAIFFTLTYSNDTLPMLYLDPLSGDLLGSYVSKWTYVRSPSARKKYKDYSLTFSRSVETVALASELQDIDLDLLSHPYRDNLDRIISLHSHPYVRQQDLVNFIKRVRKFVTPLSDCAFFACGEYGPRSLRPHFHGLLFVRDFQDVSYLSYLLRKSWRFGNVDSSLVQSSAPAYVAKYVSGNSILPPVLNIGLARPRHYCSSYTSYSSTTQQDLQEAYDSRSSVRVVESTQGSFVSSLPKSLISRYIPKLSDSDGLSFEEYLQRCDILSGSFVEVPFNYGYQQIEPLGLPPSDLCRYSRMKNEDGSFVIPSRIYSDNLKVRHYIEGAALLKVSFYSYVKFVYEFHFGFPAEIDKVSNPLRCLRSFYEAQEQSVTHEDIFVSLCQYHDLFYHFSHATNFNDLPAYLQKSFTLQHLDFLFDSRGNLLFDYYDSKFYFDHKHDSAERFSNSLKTKFINSL